ncbi:MAG: ABC transporter ATP-binding protein [Aigarchaeota archaeon]|nr:ABC transporter ATP-binding protein [Aigarchaeota archaeon]MDW8092069.1 ABC transporter ATP-binding protein [Nitrososphaerota archaeon]
MTLEVDKLSATLGPVRVLRDISLKVNDGEIVALLGRNGAGKTTTLRTIMGLVPATSGKIFLDGKDITKLPPHIRARTGIGYSPEDRKIFLQHSVIENIRIALWMSGQNESILDDVFDTFPVLREMKNRKGMYLSGGQQKMLSIARAMPLGKRLLLIDEPLEGLSPIMVRTLAERIKVIRSKRGVSILLAEANVFNALQVADRIYVIERGEIVFEGSSDEVRADENFMKKLMEV